MARNTLSPITYLTFVACTIRLDGRYISRTETHGDDEACTAHRAYAAAKASSHEPTADDAAVAAASLEWARGLGTRSEFERKMGDAACATKVTKSKIAMLAAMVGCYLRNQARDAARAAEAAATPGAYIGTVGARQELVDITVEKVLRFDGQYGPRYLYVMKDTAGNTITWWTGVGKWEAGAKVSVKATIKAHQEYKGVAQTVITRPVAI